MALRHPLFAADAIDLSADPSLADRLHVQSVPDITFWGSGGTRRTAGHAMEPVLLSLLLAAAGTV